MLLDLPARLIAYGLLLAALVAGGAAAWVTVSGWRDAAERLPRVEREYLAYRATIQGYAAGDKAARKEIDNDRAATARVRAGVPVQSVRLRDDRPGQCEPAAAGGAAGVGTPAATAGELSEAGRLPGAGGEGRDIGPGLYGLWDEADTLRDDFAACQRDVARLLSEWPQCPPAVAERRRWWRRSR